MSSFLVSESTLQDAVTCFAGFEGKSSTRAAEDLDVLGRRLWQLNCDALYDRYGSKAVNMVCTAEECADFRWRVAILDDRDTAKMCHHLKALECLIYQCSEGDCVKSDLYNAMEVRADMLRRAIVRNLPEYQKSDSWE